jgi:hypothetical protein
VSESVDAERAAAAVLRPADGYGASITTTVPAHDGGTASTAGGADAGSAPAAGQSSVAPPDGPAPVPLVSCGVAVFPVAGEQGHFRVAVGTSPAQPGVNVVLFVAEVAQAPVVADASGVAAFDVHVPRVTPLHATVGESTACAASATFTT